MNSRLSSGYTMGGWLGRVILPGFSPTPTITDPDEHWMQEAFLESLKGVGITNPNPAVGCIIVKDGNEIARGFTQAYRGKHAEAMAFESIQDRKLLVGATVYVTLEPCTHTGNQPPCCDLLLDAPVSRVVIGRGDPDPRVNGLGIRKLREAGKEVRSGILAAEITAWNLPFFASKALGRPLVALKWAQTLDGQLADDSGKSQWISGPGARSYTHWLRQRYDAILVGARTFEIDRPSLTARDCAGPIQSQPLRLVWDSRRGELFVVDHGLTFSAHSSRGILEVLRSEQITRLLGHPLSSLMVEGGAGVLSHFVQSELADAFHVFVAPILTGGDRYRVSARSLLENAKPMSVVAQECLGNDMLMETVSAELAARL